MATDIGDVVKQGYMRVRSKNVGIWQKRWIVLRRASSKGPCRMDKFLDERNARTAVHQKTALLTSVDTIARLPVPTRRHSFTVNFQHSNCKWFACDSDLEADNWVKLLIQECLLVHPGLATGEPDVLGEPIQKELQEQFHVYLMPTPKLDVFGECLLQVTHENIYLWDVVNSKLKLVAWPLTALRRYGSDPTKFTFEAGRHCATGEGMFVFHTLEGEKIYRKVHQATLAIAEAHHKTKRQTTLSSTNTDLTESCKRINGNVTTTTTTTTTTTKAALVNSTCSRTLTAYGLIEEAAAHATKIENDDDAGQTNEAMDGGDLESSDPDRDLIEFVRQHNSSCNHSRFRHQSSSSGSIPFGNRCSVRNSSNYQ